MPVVCPAHPLNEKPDPLWAELEHWILEACVLRAEGREHEAVRVMEEHLPSLIQRWSQSVDLPKADLQERLRRLFADTQAFVRRSLAHRRIVTAGLVAQGVAPRAESQPKQRPLGLRHAVPVGDIAGMLDGLAEAEREARRETLWPLRSRLTTEAAALA